MSFNHENSLIWNGDHNGLFSVKSAYTCFKQLCDANVLDFKGECSDFTKKQTVLEDNMEIEDTEKGQDLHLEGLSQFPPSSYKSAFTRSCSP